MSSKYTQTKDSQADMTASNAIELLKQGNQRFLNQNSLQRNYKEQIELTSSFQYPFASILSCIDSRISTEIIFDQGIGDIYNARIAGNFVNDDILGSLEFTCKVAGSKLIVVLGHTNCGAIMGACDGVKLGHLSQMLEKLKPAIKLVNTKDGEERNSNNMDFVNKVAKVNVERMIEILKSKSAVLNEMYESNKIDILGAMYNVSTGKVNFLE